MHHAVFAEVELMRVLGIGRMADEIGAGDAPVGHHLVKVIGDLLLRQHREVRGHARLGIDPVFRDHPLPVRRMRLRMLHQPPKFDELHRLQLGAAHSKGAAVIVEGVQPVSGVEERGKHSVDGVFSLLCRPPRCVTSTSPFWKGGSLAAKSPDGPEDHSEAKTASAGPKGRKSRPLGNY